MKNHEKIFCHEEVYGYMFICQNSEGVHPYLLKCCRGTCTFVGMLKGYMVRKRLGTPELIHHLEVSFLMSKQLVCVGIQTNSDSLSENCCTLQFVYRIYT